MNTKDLRHNQLLGDTYASPANDSRRLVYAEWIEQQAIGPAPSERAEFIRLQVQAATRKPRDPRRYSLEKKADAILARHADQWNEPLVSLGLSAVTWHRGFPIGGRIDIDRFLINGERITAAGITELFMCYNTYDMAAFAVYAPLARLTSLDLSRNYIGAGAATKLAKSVYLANLKDLNLASNAIGCAGVMAIANCRYSNS